MDSFELATKMSRFVDTEIDTNKCLTETRHLHWENNSGDWRLSASLRFNWGPFELLESSQHYCIEGFKSGPQLSPHCVERRKSFGQHTQYLPGWFDTWILLRDQSDQIDSCTNITHQIQSSKSVPILLLMNNLKLM